MTAAALSELNAQVDELRRQLAERDEYIEALKRTVDRLNADLAGSWRTVDLTAPMDAGVVRVPSGPDTPFLQAIAKGGFPDWLERQKRGRE